MSNGLVPPLNKNSGFALNILLEKIANNTEELMGSDILTGNGVPSDSLGKNNDFYLDNLTGDYYQKFNGTWGSPVGNLEGPAGPTGPQGATGPIGATGPAGGVASASNVGVGGVGVFKQLTGSNLEFKNINAGSSKISITDDTGNNEVDVDAVEANFTLNNIGGVLGETKGGTDQSTYAVGDILYSSSTNNLSKLAISTELTRLSGFSGIPAWRPFFDASREFFLYDSFVATDTTSIYGWSNNSTGTGANVSIGDPSTLIDGSHQGIVRFTTGSTNAGRAALVLPVVNMAVGTGAGQLTIQFNVNIFTALSTGTQRYTIMMGLGDANDSTEFTEGVYFLYVDNVNSGNWVGKTAHSSTRTTVNGAVAAATGWQRCKAVVNAAATSVEFFVNETSLGTSTTNIPNVAGAWIAPMLKVIKSVGTTAREIDVDYFMAYQIYTTVV